MVAASDGGTRIQGYDDGPLAYIAYLAADHLWLSGIFAFASAGVILEALQRRNDRVITNVDAVNNFWNATAFIANAIAFIATGLLIDFSRITHEPALILPGIAIVFVSRAVQLTAVFRDARSRLTAFLAGMRGALLRHARAARTTAPARYFSSVSADS